MEYNLQFYGLNDNRYDEDHHFANATTTEDENMSFVIALSVVGTFLFGGVSYYIYRICKPKKPKFEEM